MMTARFLSILAVGTIASTGCKKTDEHGSRPGSLDPAPKEIVVWKYEDPEIQEAYKLMHVPFVKGVTTWDEIMAQDRALGRVQVKAYQGDSEARRALFELFLLPEEIILGARNVTCLSAREFGWSTSLAVTLLENDYPNGAIFSVGLLRWRTYARWKLQEMGVEVEGEAAAPPEVAGLPAGTPEPLTAPEFGEFADPEVARYFAAIEGTSPETKPKIRKSAAIYPLLWLMRAGSIEAERALYSILLLSDDVLGEGKGKSGSMRTGMAYFTIGHLTRHDLQTPFYQSDTKVKFLADWRAYARWKLGTLGVEVEGEQAPPPEVVGLPAGFPAALEKAEFGEFASPEVTRLFALATAMVARRSEHRGRKPRPEVIDPLFQLMRAGSVEARRALYSIPLLTSDWPEQNGRELNWLAKSAMRNFGRYDTETLVLSGAGKRAFLAEWQAYTRRELATLGVDTTGR